MNKKVEKLEGENNKFAEIVSNQEAELLEYRQQLVISGPKEMYMQVMLADKLVMTQAKDHRR